MHFFLKQLVMTYGLQDRVVVRGTNAKLSHALQAYEEYKASGKLNTFITEVIDICVKSIEEDDVDVFVFGTGALKWMKEVLESQLDKKGYNITVINPLAIAATPQWRSLTLIFLATFCYHPKAVNARLDYHFAFADSS